MIMKKEDIKKILTENKEQLKKYKIMYIALSGSRGDSDIETR